MLDTHLYVEVREDHMKIVTIRKKFYDMPDIRRIISVRQLLCIRKVVRNSIEQIPSKKLACWVEHKRKPGRVMLNDRKPIVQNLQLLLLGEVDKVGSLKA